MDLRRDKGVMTALKIHRYFTLTNENKSVKNITNITTHYIYFQPLSLFQKKPQRNFFFIRVTLPRRDIVAYSQTKTTGSRGSPSRSMPRRRLHPPPADEKKCAAMCCSASGCPAAPAAAARRNDESSPHCSCRPRRLSSCSDPSVRPPPLRRPCLPTAA